MEVRGPVPLMLLDTWGCMGRRGGWGVGVGGLASVSVVRYDSVLQKIIDSQQNSCKQQANKQQET